MKRILSVLFLLTAFAQISEAQSTPNPAVIYPALSNEYDTHVRVLAGISGGNSFGNMFLSTDAGVEIPFAKRLEVDINDSFSPFESHVALGHGWANDVSAGGIVWVSKGKSLGLNGSTDYSNYSVSISKGSYYAHGGLTYRTSAWGSPARFTFDYFRQYKNGIACGTVATCAIVNADGSLTIRPGVNGTETDHVQGGEFGLAVRMGAVGPSIIRLTFTTSVGHVLTQSNEACDGTLGVYVPSCKRGSTVSGGASMGVIFEFPRHNGYEDSLF